MKKNYIYAFLTVFIWATLAAIAKMLLSDIPNLETLSISSVFSFVFLLLINLKNGSIKEMKKYTVKDYGIMAGLGFYGKNRMLINDDFGSYFFIGYILTDLVLPEDKPLEKSSNIRINQK